MSDTSDKREDPAPPAAPAAEPTPQPTETGPTPETSQSVTTEAPAHPAVSTEGASPAPPQFRRRRRRRRRRHHGPRPEGVAPVATANAPTTEAAAPADPAAPAPPSEATAPAQPGEAAAPAQAGEATAAAPSAPGAAPAGDQPRRRRRRRRRRKPPPGAETGAPSEAGATAAVAAAPGEPSSQTDARPPRKPWRERSRGRGRSGEGENREQRSRESGPRAEGPRGADAKRDRRDKPRGGPRKPGFGRGRDRDDGRGKKPEQKLYTSEAIVDHGFEDVAPAEEGGEARRVDWSISKRTVADQRSTRTISTVYVLKRDGTETEFPFLAAAREAVNKKIVHPEKLTQPKEAYAALYTKK